MKVYHPDPDVDRFVASLVEMQGVDPECAAAIALRAERLLYVRKVPVSRTEGGMCSNYPFHDSREGRKGTPPPRTRQ